MTEKTLQDFLIKKARQAGILAYKVVCVGRRGFPDVLLTQNGRTVFAELKNPNGKGRLSVQQIKTLNELNENGAETYVIQSKDQALELIQSYARPE